MCKSLLKGEKKKKKLHDQKRNHTVATFVYKKSAKTLTRVEPQLNTREFILEVNECLPYGELLPLLNTEEFILRKKMWIMGREGKKFCFHRTSVLDKSYILGLGNRLLRK